MGEQYYNLKIVPEGLKGAEAGAYIAGVRTHLSRIEGTESGRVLLNSIRFWHINVPITPYDDSQEPCNATVDRQHDPVSGIVYPTVRYSPATYARGSSCARALAEMGQTAAGLPQEVLFHELVHAFRVISKTARPKPIYTYDPSQGGLHRYDNDEEFIAVLLTNIYISDPSNRNKSSMRADHQSKNTLQKELAGSFEFFRSGASTFRVVDKFCKQNPGLTGAMAKVAAPFNPLAAYYQDREKAMRYSTQPLAHERDAKGYEEQFFDRMKTHRIEDRRGKGFGR